MITSRLFRIGSLLLVMLVALTAVSFGQTTYYVNGQTGLDGNNGLSPTPGGTAVGPKATINNAIAASSAGDVINVDFANGATYNENVNVTKRLSFGVTSNSGTGTPVVTSWTVNITGTNNTCTFTGAFKLNTGLTLSSGSVVGAGNLTVGGTVTRTGLSGTTSATVDAQLLYTGTVNFVYTGGFAITTGLEMAPSSSTAIGAITTTGGGTNLTLNESKTMSGVLTTSGTLNLGGFTLTISGASVLHSVAGNVSAGTLAFTLTGATTVAGNFNLPAVTASATAANTLTLNTNTTLGNVSASGSASITAGSATTTGDVTNSGSGTVTLSAATTVGNVINSSSGTVTLTAATAITSLTNSGSGTITQGAAGATAVTGNVLQTGSGSITFASTGGVTISGTLTNSPAIALTGGSATFTQTNLGFISFADGAVTVTGAVTNAPTFSGSTVSGSGTNTTVTNNGQIRFGATAATLTFTAGITVNAISNITNGGGANTGVSTITGNGAITFASTSGNILGGGITNTSNWPNLTIVTGQGAFTQTGNGSIIIASRTTGTIGTGPSPFGAISNSSTATNGSTNGDINLGPGGGFFGTSLSSTGGAGGYIILGNESVTLSGGITNARTSAPTSPAGHIQIGTALTAAVNISVGGDVNNSGGSRIVFNSYDNAAAETFAVAGNLVSSGTGAIWVRLATQTGTGAMTFGGINLTAGTIDLSGAGAATATLTVNGTTNFAGGTLTLTTSAARTLRLGALTNNFSTATGSTVFTSTANVTLTIQASTIFGQQIVNGNATPTVWYGSLNVNNTNNNAISPGVIFQGGNFRILRNVTFAGSLVNLNNVIMFVGGQPPAYAAQGGNFTNTSGYTTTGNAFVSMNNSTANQNVSGAGNFGNLEIDCAANTVTFTTAATMTATFNLTSGTVVTSANVTFNNATTPPTIVRNAGIFDASPTFTTAVNVYYIGLDKGTSNELPLAANRLNDLTVATTNGATAGKGTVNVGVATTVNGTLNVFSGQALLINGVNLTMNGATITLTGDITNDVGAVGRLVLGRTAGTTITGSGALPSITVNAASNGNAITGSVGLANGLLGADNVRTAADDVPPGTGGSITFIANAGSNTSSLTATFGTANTTTNVHLGGGVTTAAAATFTLGANLNQGGNLVHAAGTVNVGTFTYRHNGVAPVFTGGALTTGAGGTLAFRGAANTLFGAVTSDVTIVANVEVNLTAAGTLFQVDQANAGNLIISGNLTITQGTVQLGDGVTGRNLTLTGTTFTVGANGSINTVGLGTLRLNAALPPMTMSFTGTPTLGNVRVSNDVTLAGTGTALTVNGTLTHDGGALDFNTRTLTAAGTYTRSAGTYSATTGYFVFSGTAFNQGSTAVTIPNLRLSSGAVTIGGTGTITVSTALDVNTTAAFTHTTSTVARLNVADGATVTYVQGSFDVAPVYAGTITLISAIDAPGGVNTNGTIHATVWPSTPTTLVTTLRIAHTSTGLVVAASGNGVYLPGNRTLNGTLDLRNGILDLSSGNATARTLTLVDNATVRRRQPGSLTLDRAGTGVSVGTITFGTNTSVWYESNNAVAYTVGPELPATVNNITFTRTANVGNAAVTVNKAVTVSGTLTIRNDLTTTGPGAPVGTISANGDVTIATETATYSAAIAPATTFGAALQFVGTASSTITVPTPSPATAVSAALGAITINKTGGAGVTLAGGNMSSTFVTFTSGLFTTGSNYLLLFGNTVNSATPGYFRSVAAGVKSHVVGTVAVPLKLGQIVAFGRNEFPVGDANNYRPAALTFVNSALPLGIGLGVTAFIRYDPTSPTGIIGMPIANGVAPNVDVSRYPGFNWSISTTGSLGSTQFNLELTAEGYIDFDDVANIRLIRRNGTLTDVTNQWLLQGAQYDNFVISGVPTVVNVNSVGGLIQGGAVFTYGLKSNMFVSSAIANQTLPDGNRTFRRKLTNPAVFGGNAQALTFSASSSNTVVASVAITSGDSLTVRGLVAGTSTITVTATNAVDGRISTSFTVTVTGVTPVDPTELIPTEFALAQNYPNPFNPSTTIRFSLPKESPVTLDIYNMLGVKVRSLIAGQSMNAAFHSVVWDGKDDAGVTVSSGVYLYRISADKFVSSKKMTLLK